MSILGTARHDYAPAGFRNRPYVNPRTGSLFSHQRNLLHHLFESEEFALLQALGFRRSLDELTIATDTQIRMLNGNYFAKDELLRGTTELYLHRFCEKHGHRVVLIARVPNMFGNNVALYASPCDTVQNNLFEMSAEKDMAQELTDTDALMEFRHPWLVSMQFNRYACHDIYMKDNQELFVSNEWKITHVAIVTVFDTARRLAKRQPEITVARTVCSEDELPHDFDVIFSSSGSESSWSTRSDEDRRERDDERSMMVDESATETEDRMDTAVATVATTSNGDNRIEKIADSADDATTAAFSSLDLARIVRLRPSLRRLYNYVEVNSFGNLPCLTSDGGCGSPIDKPLAINVRELAQMVVPLGYLNTVLLDNTGTGRYTSILSLCMFDDSRNNWIFSRRYMFPRMLKLIEQFPTCRYHVIVNADGLRDFVRNFERYSNECNVIVIESSLAQSKSWFRDARAYRTFYCDQRYTRRAVLYGTFNYLLAWRSRYDWFADHFYSSHMTLTTHALCVEKMYDLPPLVDRPIFYRLPFRVNDDVFSAVYNPNSSHRANSDQVLRQLFEREFRRLTDDNDDNDDEVRRNILYLEDRVKNSPCVICFGRDHDYYVTTCCRSPICLSCSESVRTSLCPACRTKVPSVVCFMLRADELTANSIRFKDHRLKSQVLAYHLQQLLSTSSACHEDLAIKVLVVNYDALLYQKLVKRKLGYMVYLSKKTDLHSVGNFLADKRPSVLFCSCKYLLTGLDLHLVSHVFVMKQISCREMGYLLSRVYRFPRKQPLVIRQFLPRDGKTALARIREREVTVPTFLARSIFYPQTDFMVDLNMDSGRFV